MSVGFFPKINGLEVVFCDYLTETKKDYPKDRFIEYGPEDDWWLAKYHPGFLQTVPSQTIYRVGNKMVAHPKTIDAIFNDPLTQQLKAGGNVPTGRRES